MNGLARWLRGWRVTVRIARREAWRGWPARRRSVLVTVLVGLPVLAASGYLTLVATSTSWPTRAAVLAQLPPGAQAVLRPESPGQAITQDLYGNVPASASAPADERSGVARRPSVTDQLSALHGRIPPGDRLTVRREGTLVAFDPTGPDRYSVTARTATDPTGATADPDLLQVAGVGAIHAGHPPSADREVLVNPALAALLQLSPGSSVTVATGTDPGAARVSAVVSGIADVTDVSGPALVGRPGGLPRDRVVTAEQDLEVVMAGGVLVTGPTPVTWTTVQAVNALGWSAVSRDVVTRAPEPAASAPGHEALPNGGADPAVGLLQAELTGLVLLQLVLLAAPAMAVGARRREHALAQVAVTGADRAAVRRVVLALAALMAAPGAVLGAVAGVGTALTLLSLTGDLPPDGRHVALPWAGVAALAATGIGVAVLAALIPAIMSARLDPVAVLRGRRGDARPRRRTGWIGLLLVVLGTAGTFLAARHAGVSTVPRAAFTVLGIAVAEIGFILCLPAVIALVARTAERGPLFLRMALRDADRHRLRTVPAVAAATAAIAGSIAAQMYFTARQAEFGGGPQRTIRSNALVLDLDLSMPLTPTDADRWRAQAERALAGSAVRDLTLIWTLGRGASAYGTASRPPWGTVDETVPRSSVEVGYVPPPGACIIPDAEELRPVPLLCTTASQHLHRPSLHLGIAVGDERAVSAQVGTDLPEAARALAAGRAVVTDPRLLWPDGTVHVRRWTTSYPTTPAPGAERRTTRVLQEFAVPAVAVDSPVLFEGVLPTAAVRRAAPDAFAELRATTAVARLNWAPSWFGPSEELRTRLETLAPAAYAYGPDHSDQIRQLAMLAFATLVTLFGAASAVALAAAEGRADAATLAAVGAAPRTRRNLAAMQALTIAGLGGAGGVICGLLAGWALVQVHATGEAAVSTWGPGGVVYGSWATPPGDSTGGWQAGVPWVDVVALGVVLPLALAGIAYLLTRSRLPMVRRRT